MDRWPCALQTACNTVSLYTWKEETAGCYGGEGKERCIDFERTRILGVTVRFFEIVGGATAVLTGDFIVFFVDLT